MPDPTPSTAPTPDTQSSSPQENLKAGWRPTASTVQGGILGAALSQVVIAFIENVFMHGGSMTSATAGALATLCTIGLNYLNPDGGRK